VVTVSFPWPSEEAARPSKKACGSDLSSVRVALLLLLLSSSLIKVKSGAVKKHVFRYSRRMLIFIYKLCVMKYRVAAKLRQAL